LASHSGRKTSLMKPAASSLASSFLMASHQSSARWRRCCRLGVPLGSTPVAPSSPLRWQPYLGTEIHGLGTQADFGRNLKPAPAAKLLVFSDFLFALAFRKVLFVFCILSPPRVAQSRLLKSHIKVRFTWQTKVDFFSRNSKVRSTRHHKVDFGF
jgi:hypothetical protein